MELDKLPAFAGLSEAEVEGFVAACAKQTLKAGQQVITQEQPVANMYFVYDGKLRVFIAVRKREHELATLNAPSVFGEMELFTGGVGPANVTAVVETRALVMSHVAFRTRLDRADAAALKITRNFARVLAYRLSATDRKIAELLAKDGPATKELQNLKQKLFGEWNV